MKTAAEKLISEIHSLPDVEKLQLVDAILSDLDKPDPEIDRVWAEEARKRWNNRAVLHLHRKPNYWSDRKK